MTFVTPDLIGELRREKNVIFVTIGNRRKEFERQLVAGWHLNYCHY